MSRNPIKTRKFTIIYPSGETVTGEGTFVELLHGNCLVVTQDDTYSIESADSSTWFTLPAETKVIIDAIRFTDEEMEHEKEEERERRAAYSCCPRPMSVEKQSARIEDSDGNTIFEVHDVAWLNYDRDILHYGLLEGEVRVAYHRRLKEGETCIQYSELVSADELGHAGDLPTMNPAMQCHSGD